MPGPKRYKTGIRSKVVRKKKERQGRTWEEGGSEEEERRERVGPFSKL